VKRVAILGASANRAKFGNRSVRAHAAAGWEVVPVNPKGGTIERLAVARALAEVPRPVERISVYLPPPTTLALLPEMAALAPAEVWFNPGSADAHVFAEARRLGLPAIDGCSIVDVGFAPADFD
jgi:hypothetical protein